MSTKTEQKIADRTQLLKLQKQMRALIVRTALAEVRFGRSEKRFKAAAAEFAGAAADLIYELDKEIHDHRLVDTLTGYDDCQQERV